MLASLTGLVVAACGSGSAALPPGSLDLQANLIVSGGMPAPTDVDQPPGDGSRLFVCEQNTGRVRIVEDGVLQSTPFLDIGADASQGGEQGLLSLVFHPDFQVNRRFYVSFTDNNGGSTVREYQASAADPDVADVSTMRTIFGPLPELGGNHNGGCLQFGMDEMLYLSIGDGAECCADPLNRSQDPTQAFGKLLRFDPDLPEPFAPADNPFFGGAGDSDFVWALGLRNPWRFSFDSQTGGVWIADVGDQAREEISFLPASQAAGANYGWHCLEGTVVTGLGGCSSALVAPVHQYDTHSGNPMTCAVIGGFVYRGAAIPALVGRYVFADSCSGNVWSIALLGGGAVDLVDHSMDLKPPSGWSITSFGEGSDGELYIVDAASGGQIWRIDPAATVAAASFCELTVLRDQSGSGTDAFASSVAVAGDTAVVGAGQTDALGTNSGAAHLYRYDAASSWAWTKELVPDDGGPGDAFGTAVAVDGKIAVVGAPFRAAKGGAYVFEQTLFGGWVQSAKLLAADGALGDELGRAVDVSGSLIVVGAPHDDDAGLSSGSAYVFESTAASSFQRAKLQASAPAAGDELGISVAIDGQTVVVGAHLDADAGANAGAVYVFEQDVLGAWIETAKLAASDAATGDRFGVSVVLEGDTLLVGANGDDDMGVNSGSVYVFERSGGVWAEIDKWLASDGALLDQFGASLSLSGDWAVVGASGNDQAGGNAGAAYVFRRNLTVWQETGKLLAATASVGDQLGRAVALSGPDALLANRFDHVSGTGNGAAHVFQLFGDAPLWGCPLGVSVSSGGAQQLALDATSAVGLEVYWMLGSASGTKPGIAGEGLVLPLNLDSYFLFRMMSPGLPPLSAALGSLSAQGTATTLFTLPPGMPPTLAGTTLHHAYVALDLFTLETLFVSNPVPVHLGP